MRPARPLISSTRTIFIILALCSLWSVGSSLRRPRGCFFSKFWFGGRPMTAPRIKLFFPLIYCISEHEAGQAASIVFQIFGVSRPGFEPSMPAPVAHARDHPVPELIIKPKQFNQQTNANRFIVCNVFAPTRNAWGTSIHRSDKEQTKTCVNSKIYTWK